VVGEANDLEMADIRARPATLAAVAQWSGGEALAAEGNESGSVVHAAVGDQPATIKYLRTPLWDRGWFLAAIIGLLSAEWIARRVRGMA
jgi:hypothetical protein